MHTHIEMKHIAHYYQHMEYKQIWKPEKTFYGEKYTSISVSSSLFLSLSLPIISNNKNSKIHNTLYCVWRNVNSEKRREKKTKILLAWSVVTVGGAVVGMNVRWRCVCVCLNDCNFFTFYSATLLRYDIWNEQTKKETHKTRNNLCLPRQRWWTHFV